ncbi:lysine-sensitive aspartokinase 3 [bacterium]|nr:MAG: lysine-sensitive aspartokinase 3 [bacterium]
MKVMKFGGTSVADAKAWKQVYSIVSQEKDVVIVVSATTKTTNDLLLAADLAKENKLSEALEVSERILKRHTDIIDELVDDETHSEIFTRCYEWINKHIELLNNYLLGIHTLGELTPRSNDVISSLGERLSSFLIAQIGPLYSVDSIHVDSKEVIKTNSDFGKAIPKSKDIAAAINEVKEPLEAGKTVIMGGFYGSNSKGEITTLGRGGSDYTASLVGLALGVDDIEIWTDVSGMYTCDPRMVPTATPIPDISFNEAAELAYFGAKVLHPATIQPAVERNIPVWIKNTFRPNDHGTKIYATAPLDDTLRAIAFKKDITIVTVTSTRMLLAYGFLARVFNIFEKHQVSVDLVSTSEVSVSMSVDSKERLDPVIEELMEVGHVHIHDKMALVCVVGQRFLKSTGIAARVFKTVDKYPIQLISQGSSDINLSFVVENEHLIYVVQELHKEFFEK